MQDGYRHEGINSMCIYKERDKGRMLVTVLGEAWGVAMRVAELRICIVNLVRYLATLIDREETKACDLSKILQ